MQARDLFSKIVIYMLPLIAVIVLLVNRKREIILRCFDAIRITFSIALTITWLWWGRITITFPLLMMFGAWSLVMGITLFIIQREKEKLK